MAVPNELEHAELFHRAAGRRHVPLDEFEAAIVRTVAQRLLVDRPTNRRSQKGGNFLVGPDM